MTELPRAARPQHASALPQGARSFDTEEGEALREALREQQARFARVAAAVPGVICELRKRSDGSTAFAYASPQIRDIFGLRAEDLTLDARPALARIHVSDAPCVLSALDESARTLTPCCLEFRVLHPERGELWVELRATPARGADGSSHWYGFLADVTARRQADLQLRSAQERLLAALHASGMGTWVWDELTDTLELDDVALALYGRTRAEAGPLSGEKILSFMHPDDVPRVASQMRRAHASNRGYRVEFRVLHPDGCERRLAIEGRGTTEASGRVTRMTGVIMDITSQHSLQNAQLRAQKLEALGTLAGGIAHDFNNLLFSMLGNTKLLASELPMDHPVQEGLAEIEHAAQRAADLVRGLLTFSRPGESRLAAVCLRAVIEDALKLLRVTLPSRIELSVEAPAELPPVAADASQLHQMLVNLLTNAAHAIGEQRGTIALVLEPVQVAEIGPGAVPGLEGGPHLRLSVRDSGAGIEPAMLERIFDPFFTTKQPGQGTGLGLSVAHSIMRNHFGAISVDSAPGRGSVFRLYFPVLSRPVEVAPVAPRPMVANRTRSERILIVDDEATLVSVTTRILSRLGYRPTGHTDAHAALAAFRAAPETFDAVVTDLSMPAMSGFELVRQLFEVRPDIPVLMTSGYLGDDARAQADAAGIRALIPKPNTVEMLGEALDRLFVKA
ncbi:MAG TPA: PAS domain-containing protein [Polyangiales bacterium]|nr:PAS domain-containing protein [Polyangiales bacterium]